MAKNDLSTFLARSRPTIQSWITTATAASVTRIVTQNYITNTVDLTGYITTTAGDIRYYPRTELDATFADVIENSHEQMHDITGGDHTAAGAELGMVILAGGVLEMEDGSTVELEDDSELDLEIDTLDWGYLGHSSLIGIAADDHHDPVTTADSTHIAISGQILSAGSDMALRDIDNTFSTSQNITGGLTATGNIASSAGNITAGTYITAVSYITATNGNITATNGNILAPAGNVDIGGWVDAEGTITAGTGLSAGTTLQVGTDANIDGTLQVDLDTTIDGDLILPFWTIDNTSGYIRSTNPVFSAGDDGAGVSISPGGEVVAQHGSFRRGLHATAFVFDTITVHDGDDIWTAGGGGILYDDVEIAENTLGITFTLEMEDDTVVEMEDDTSLELDYTLAYDTVEDIPGTPLFSFIAEHPQIGEFQRFMEDDIVQLRGLGVFEDTEYTGEGVGGFRTFPAHLQASPNSRNLYGYVWGKVTVAVKGDTYTTYTAELLAISDFPLTIRAGSGIANYGDTSDTSRERGYLRATVTDGFSPRFEAGRIGESPWESDGMYPSVVMGRLDGSALVTSREHGILIAANAEDADSAYIKATQSGLEIRGAGVTLLDDSDTLAVDLNIATGLDIYVGEDDINAVRFKTTYTSIGELSVGGMVSEWDTTRGIPPLGTPVSETVPALLIKAEWHAGNENVRARSSIYQNIDGETIVTDPGSRVFIQTSHPESTVAYSRYVGGSIEIESKRFGEGFRDSIWLSSDYISLVAPSIQIGSAITKNDNIFQVGSYPLGGMLSWTGSSINISGLPTSSTGLNLGDMYIDAGILKVKI